VTRELQLGAGTFEYVLPGVTRCLSANELNGGHWRVGARLRKEWRGYGTAAWYAAGRPRWEGFTTALHYRPRNRRVRDVENLVGGALKCLNDGMVLKGLGIAADDNGAHYRTTLPVIHEPDNVFGPAVWVVVSELVPVWP